MILNFQFLKGVSGSRCDSLDNEKLPCSSNPCYAGAKCYNYKDDYMCDCPLGTYNQKIYFNHLKTK